MSKLFGAKGVVASAISRNAVVEIPILIATYGHLNFTTGSLAFFGFA